MNIEIKIILKEEKEILNRMLQLYLHDISLYFPIKFNSDIGMYEYDSLDKYFDNSDNFAYFITEENNILGFILVDKVDNGYVVQEMFILNNYKSKGIGKIAIKEIFNKYKGNWIIRCLPLSSKAESFWIRVVKEYTNDNYNIEHVGKYNRAVLTFNNE